MEHQGQAYFKIFDIILEIERWNRKYGFLDSRYGYQFHQQRLQLRDHQMVGSRLLGIRSFKGSEFDIDKPQRLRLETFWGQRPVK